jgi:hypothetical protein
MSKRFEDFMQTTVKSLTRLNHRPICGAKLRQTQFFMPPEDAEVAKKARSKNFFAWVCARVAAIGNHGNGHRLRHIYQSQKGAKSVDLPPLTLSMPNSRCTMHRWLKLSLPSLKRI